MSHSTEMKSMLFGTGGPFQVSSPENSIDTLPSENNTYTTGIIDFIQGKVPENSLLDMREITPSKSAQKLYVESPQDTEHQYKIIHGHPARDWSSLDDAQVCYIWGKDTLSFPATISPSLTSSAIISPSKYIEEHFGFIRKAYSSEMDEALHDLQKADSEASEEGYLPPSEIAIKNAERILREMYAISSRRYEIYPTPDREVAIDASGGYGRSVILLFDSDGGVLCLVNMNGKHRRARYSSTEILPDGFLREALAELEQENA